MYVTVMKPRCGWAGNPSGKNVRCMNRMGSHGAKECLWWTSMMNGDVLSGGLKKFGQTRPPNRSSILAAASWPIIFEKKKRNTPLQTGHTGRRANFSDLATVRRLEMEGVDTSSGRAGVVSIEENLATALVGTRRGARNASPNGEHNQATSTRAFIVAKCEINAEMRNANGNVIIRGDIHFLTSGPPPSRNTRN